MAKAFVLDASPFQLLLMTKQTNFGRDGEITAPVSSTRHEPAPQGRALCSMLHGMQADAHILLLQRMDGNKAPVTDDAQQYWLISRIDTDTFTKESNPEKAER